MGVAVRDGQTYLTFTAPPEEQMESAGARVRPLLLDRDPVHVPKVFKALSYLLRDDPTVVKFLRDRRRDWERRVQEDGVPADGYRVMHMNTGTGQFHEANDRQLALAWLYGDVVHHDLDRRALGDEMGLEQRYQGAIALLAFLIRHAVSTLRMIEQLREAGVLSLRDEVFQAPVVVTETSWEYAVDIYRGAPHQDLPADITAPGDGWEKWQPGLG